MSRSRRHRNHQRNDTLRNEVPRRHGKRWGELHARGPDHGQARLGRHRVGGWNRDRASEPYRPPNPRRNQTTFPNHTPRRAHFDPFTSPNTSPALVHDAFRLKSKTFKSYMVDTLQRVMLQLREWLPEENSPATDGMDWQHEAEFVIPNPVGDVDYIWNRPPYNTMYMATRPVAGQRRLTSETNFASRWSDSDGSSNGAWSPQMAGFSSSCSSQSGSCQGI